MKRFAVLVCTCFMCCFLAASAVAHGCGTDSKGGHMNRSTGEYHYHHGYSSHQHTNGTCPYDFVDKTGQNSGTPSNGKSESRKDNKDEGFSLGKALLAGCVYVGIHLLRHIGRKS